MRPFRASASERPAGRVVVAGSLSLKAHQGGHTWQFLNYLLGFRRLGWDVLFLDRLDPDMSVDRHGEPCPVERSVNARYLAAVMDRFGLAQDWALVGEGGRQWVGVPRHEAIERARGSLLVNVMGYLTDERVLEVAERRVFVDTDPGFGQMWKELGLADVFDGHDVYVTIAENIGREQCGIPTAGIKWVTSPQPVVVDEWASNRETGAGPITSIGAWRGPYGPLEFRGQTYGQRVHEFRQYLDLPSLTGAAFEAALDIDPADQSDIELLRKNGWTFVDPRLVTCDPDTYRSYIRSSKAELMIARGMYVKTVSGWFSERSMCYLASGRPVLAQDTGIRELYPTGEGLVVFSTPEEAAAGVDAILADYPRHCCAAREIAREYFNSDRVLPQLLEKLAIA